MTNIYTNFKSFSKYPSIDVGPIAILWLEKNEVIPAAEIESVLNASEKTLRDSYKSKNRRFEFERSRWLIRTSTKYSDPLEKTKFGSPGWPDKHIGSITHKEGYVGIAIHPESDFIGLGIDAENPNRMKVDFAERVLVDEEKSMIDVWSKNLAITPEAVMTIIFSFKESIFKCVFPLGGEMFYFPDAQITNIDPDGKIEAKILIETSPHTNAGCKITGNYVYWQNDETALYLTCAYLKN
jgi:4'-phosphopantetheinyl transferase EntD